MIVQAGRSIANCSLSSNGGDISTENIQGRFHSDFSAYQQIRITASCLGQ